MIRNSFATQVLSADTDTLKATLSSLGIYLKPVMYKMDVRPLLKAVLDQFFGRETGLVDMIVEHIPSPVMGSDLKVCRYATKQVSHSHRVIGLKKLHWPPNVEGRRSDALLR